MPKLEDKTTYYELDGIPNPKNNARVVNHGDNIGLRETAGQSLVNPTLYSDWTDSTDTPYASRALLLTAIATITFA